VTPCHQERRLSISQPLVYQEGFLAISIIRRPSDGTRLSPKKTVVPAEPAPACFKVGAGTKSATQSDQTIRSNQVSTCQYVCAGLFQSDVGWTGWPDMASPSQPSLGRRATSPRSGGERENQVRILRRFSNRISRYVSALATHLEVAPWGPASTVFVKLFTWTRFLSLAPGHSPRPPRPVPLSYVTARESIFQRVVISVPIIEISRKPV
jgi:hypothetical protein